MLKLARHDYIELSVFSNTEDTLAGATVSWLSFLNVACREDLRKRIV